MNLIILISFCAALVIYFDAEKLNIKPWSWCALAFFSCFISYYIIYFIVGFALVSLNYYINPLVNISLTIFTYGASLVVVRPISKKMKASATKQHEETG